MKNKSSLLNMISLLVVIGNPVEFVANDIRRKSGIVRKCQRGKGGFSLNPERVVENIQFL